MVGAVEPLHRIFQAITDGMPPDLSNGVSNGVPRHAELIARLEAEQAKNIIFQDTIADLRRRLDDEAAERRRLTALLADLRAPQPAPPAAPRRWWRW